MPHWSRRLAIVALTALVGGSLVGSGTQAAGGAARKVRPNVQMSAIACTWFGKHQTKAGFNCPVAPPTDANTIKALAKATATKAQKSRPANLASSAVKFGSNVDATDPSEDLASGQSETAVAALGRYVVSAWNDASGFLVGDATLPQASITGLGFSADAVTTYVKAP